MKYRIHTKYWCAVLIGGIVSLVFLRFTKKEVVNEGQYADLLDIAFTPQSTMAKGNYYHAGFADKGAWFGYYLPEDEKYWGGFSGPFIIAGEFPVYFAKYLSNIRLLQKNKAKWEQCRFTHCTQLHYYPGYLIQTLRTEDFEVQIKLSYVDANSAIISYCIKNLTPEKQSIRIQWEGELLPYKDDLYINKANNGLEIGFKGIKDKWSYYSHPDMSFSIYLEDDIISNINHMQYTLELADIIVLAPKAEKEINLLQSYTFNKKELLKLKNQSSFTINQAQKIHTTNKEYWKQLVKQIANKSKSHSSYLPLALKALVTINSNRRSAQGQFKNETVMSNSFFKWYNGVWSFDTWIISCSLAAYHPELAKNNIRNVFNNQIQKSHSLRPWDAGMLCDCIFYLNDKEGSVNWNERNSKPPIAAWAIWQVFEQTRDTSFVLELLPKVRLNHDWWFRNRDHDKNGVCEYGCTIHKCNVVTDSKPESNVNQCIRAIRWESRGDYGIRFHDDFNPKVLFNTIENLHVGYSVNQESVDLNCFLVNEKKHLEKMYLLKNDFAQAKLMNEEAKILSDFICQYMFDADSGYFYDIDIDTKKPLTERGKGPEGWIPLWANIAEYHQALAVKETLMDDQQFNANVPFTTAPINNSRFVENGFWNGPVCLTSAWFGIVGLSNYNYDVEAKLLCSKLLLNAKGLLSEGSPIFQNYNPITGNGNLGAHHSCSSAACLMLFEFISEKE